MTSYVLDKLRHVDREEDQMILAESIVKNAEGIFVWVTLVVKRIREQIENGACPETLQRELGALPKELDSLFDHILNSLADSDLRAAYQTFSMVTELKRYNLSLSLLSYSFLDDFSQDRGFALRKDAQYWYLSPTNGAQRTDLARKRLNACCKGLLDTRKDDEEPASEIIVITHRSISEFLLSRGRRCRVEPYLEGFNTVDAISQLTLGEFMVKRCGRYHQRIPIRQFGLSTCLLPSTVSILFGTTLYPATQDQFDWPALGDVATEVTLWHRILLHCLVHLSYPRGDVSLPVLPKDGCIIEKFLKYGADPHFCISVTNSPKFQISLVTRVQGERREQRFTNFLHSEMQPSDCENISLADLVQSWNLKNKSPILELIEINTLKIEGAIAEENIMLLKELTAFTPGMEEPEDLEDTRELPLESLSDGTMSAIDSAANKRRLAGIFAFGREKLGFYAGISIAILILGKCRILPRKSFRTYTDNALGTFLAAIIHR